MLHKLRVMLRETLKITAKGVTSCKKGGLSLNHLSDVFFKKREKYHLYYVTHYYLESVTQTLNDTSYLIKYVTRNS